MKSDKPDPGRLCSSFGTEKEAAASVVQSQAQPLNVFCLKAGTSREGRQIPAKNHGLGFAT